MTSERLNFILTFFVVSHFLIAKVSHKLDIKSGFQDPENGSFPQNNGLNALQ